MKLISSIFLILMLSGNYLVAQQIGDHPRLFATKEDRQAVLQK